MPYIEQRRRKELDFAINDLCYVLTSHLEISSEDYSRMLGDLNYTISRLIVSAMGKTTYPKIAMTTGVLENVKQEFYRRVAVPYEEEKIVTNGDIKEYENRHLFGGM